MREFLSDVGCRIIENEICENEDELSLLKNISTCILNDVMHRLYGVNPKIKLLNPETAVKMIGRACTVKTAPGDTLLLHHALELAWENDVIVVDGQGETQRAVGGEIILRLAQMKGISGIVVDGVLRDISGIQELTMPVFALGTSNIDPGKMDRARLMFLFHAEVRQSDRKIFLLEMLMVWLLYRKSTKHRL